MGTPFCPPCWRHLSVAADVQQDSLRVLPADREKADWPGQGRAALLGAEGCAQFWACPALLTGHHPSPPTVFSNKSLVICQPPRAPRVPVEPWARGPDGPG